MALVICKESGGGISSKAKECSHCGAPFKSGFNDISKLIGIVLFIIGILGVLYFWSSFKTLFAF